MAQKAFVPTDDQRAMVLRMVLAGVQRDVIAKCVINPATQKPITQKTLKSHFAEQLDHGDAKANSKVVAALFRAATGNTSGPQVAAAIFWTKTKLGWREVSKMELDANVNTGGAVVVPGQMTPETWQETIDQYDRLGPPPLDIEDDEDDEFDLGEDE